MLTIYNDQHALHQGKVEMFRGELVPCFEVPDRVDHVKHELERRGLGPLQVPDDFDEALLAKVHAPRYLDFIAHAWEEWVALDAACLTIYFIKSFV
jgi:acetoin utilization deacetylase AcuC-like enzyme